MAGQEGLPLFHELWKSFEPSTNKLRASTPQRFSEVLSHHLAVLLAPMGVGCCGFFGYRDFGMRFEF